MNNGTTYLNCGEAMRFYDSGGPAGNYRNNENYIHTFVSPGRPVSIQFQSFHTENFSYDKMYIYDGGSINAPLLGSELGGDLDGNLPGPYVSTGDSLTILFISNASTAYSGWEAVVGVDYAPVTVKAEVLDSITVSLSSASPLPLHYNGSTVLTAAPAGGRGAQYAYQWYTGSDGINWVLTSETSSAFAVNNLTVPTYYRVSVQDISPDACGGIAYSTIFLNVADIHLSLELSVAKRDICTGDFPLYVTIRNQGDEPATGVVATLNLPYNIILRDTISGMDFGTVPPQDSVTRTVNLYTWSGKDPMPALIKAQIESADQGDRDFGIVYGDWDWTGFPRQQDEDTLSLRIGRTSRTHEIVSYPSWVCAGEDAVLEASSTLSYPQYFYWYSDSTGKNLIEVDTVNLPGLRSSVTIPRILLSTTRYVTVGNDSICPSYPSLIKDFTMANGTTVLHFGDIIRFYDSGGPQANYSNGENYTHTFISEDGMPVSIRFNSFLTENNYDYMDICDGPTSASPALSPRLTGKVLPGTTYTSTGESLTVYFHSDNSQVREGWEAVVSYCPLSLQDTIPDFSSELVPVHAYLKEFADPATVTAISDIVCDGNEAVLAAYSTIDFPQVIRWYADSLLNSLVFQDTLDGVVKDLSRYVVSPPYGPLRYYVTVGNDSLCPIIYNHKTTVLTMANGSAILAPGETIKFYDSGGPNGNYANNERYAYTISSEDGAPVTLLFSAFDTENCCDYLNIYDGPDIQAPLLKTLRGTVASSDYGPYVSAGSSLTFRFYSDQSTNNSGWEAQIYGATFLSAAVAEIEIAPSYHSIFTDTVCQSTIPYSNSRTDRFSSIDVSVEGNYTYYDTLTTSQNCDSIFTLQLTVLITSDQTLNDEICFGDLYQSNGFYVNTADSSAPGLFTYVHSLTTEGGCDSIVRLHLNVLPVHHRSFSAGTCYGEIYNANGFYVNTADSAGPGVYDYRQVYTASGGCDSILTLTLTVYPSGFGSSILYDTVVSCNPGYYYGDSLFNESGTKTVLLKNRFGCDSLQVMATVYINHPSDSNYYFNLNCRDTVIALNWGECDATFHLLPPGINHHIYDHINGDTAITFIHDSPDVLEEGEYDITWIAVDHCGHSDTCTQHITIRYPPCTQVVDYDGNVYPGVKIGCNCWMQTNIVSLHYADGRAIEDAWGYYADIYPDTARNIAIFGRLYSWYAAMDSARPSPFALGERPQGICPDGWVLPAMEDFRTLMVYGASALKSTNYWMRNPGTNSTGFTALPAGYYNASADRFYQLMGNTYFWTSSDVPGTETGRYVDLSYDCEDLLEFTASKGNGYSVRCIKK